jgi:hypothetical protein
MQGIFPPAFLLIHWTFFKAFPVVQGRVFSFSKTLIILISIIMMLGSQAQILARPTADEKVDLDAMRLTSLFP